MIGQGKKGRARVVVAMSGGVDSSVAAALLVEQGYDVIGVMMRLWSEEGREMLNRCCTPEQMEDARHIAGQLGIPFYVLDVKDYFRERIVQFYLDEHARGRTPNPCVECNRDIRFHFLYERARALQADFLATGHYARLLAGPAGPELHQGVDRRKDQSYVLHVLKPDQLPHVLFPVGYYTKEAVRELAERFRLPTAQKSDSMDLCFLSGQDYRAFLQRHGPESGLPGPILSSSGETLGRHDGLPNFTIGQRKGLGLTAAEPVFVVAKDATRNALIVGPRVKALSTEVRVRGVNWLLPDRPATGLEVEVKVRYKAPLQPAILTPETDGGVHLRFDRPVFAATPGQAAVFYQGSRCLGGGLIADFLPDQTAPAPLPTTSTISDPA